MSKFERGITSPPASDVVNWAREYGMTIDHFIEAARNLRYDKEVDQ